MLEVDVCAHVFQVCTVLYCFSVYQYVVIFDIFYRLAFWMKYLTVSDGMFSAVPIFFGGGGG